MQSIDFSAQISAIDFQISDAKTYLKKLRDYKRVLISVQKEESAIALLTSPALPLEQNQTISITLPECPLEQVDLNLLGDSDLTLNDLAHAIEVSENDPWTQPAEEVVDEVAIAAPAAPTLYLLPPAKDVAIAQPAMTRDQLRKACQAAGIPWRNFHAKNKHMSVAEMRDALQGGAIAA